MKPIHSAWLLALGTLTAQEFTRGVGVYPSSSYDYNLTAQFVTDGIKDTKMPRYLAVETSQQGPLPKNQRESLLDGNWVTDVSLKGPRHSTAARHNNRKHVSTYEYRSASGRKRKGCVAHYALFCASSLDALSRTQN